VVKHHKNLAANTGDFKMDRVNALIELIKYLWTGRTKKQRAYSAAILAGCDDDRFQRWYRKNVDKHAKFVSPFENTPDQYAALREIADFAEQFIGDDEDGDERMYKVHQIADNAIPFIAETTELYRANGKVTSNNKVN
jgi:hypothetical protein